jgi:raffinose/stachyose/melibiose transport system permease protein
MSAAPHQTLELGRLFRWTPYLLASVWTLLTLLPLVWMYYASLKSLPDFNLNRWSVAITPHFENYVEAWTGSVPGGDFRAGTLVPLPFSSYFTNSVIITFGSLAMTMALASLGGYALARHPIPGKRLLVGLVLVALAIPVHALVLPIWFVENAVGLVDTHLGAILAYTATGMPFALILLTSYFRSFPAELEDAARVDGCSDLGVLWRIVLPMSKGPMAAVAILLANGFWNEFLYALVLLPSNGMKTLPVGLFNYAGEHFTPYTVLLAALCIATTPLLILYLFFQRQVTSADIELVR